MVDDIVARAVAAQAEIAGWAEERVDAMLGDVARAIASNAAELGSATVAETGIGEAGAKAEKILFGSAGVYASFAGQPGSGLVHTDDERRVREIASPVGVVFAMTPVTEPVSTYVNKVLIALKGRNSIIVSPHRASLRTASAADDLVQQVLTDHGAPAGLVQLVRNRVSRAMTYDFMSHPSVHLILATGGSAMVSAAYSSGTPAIGVGPGNAPVWIAPDADLVAAAACIVESKAFDHGLVCGAEQHLVVDESVYEPFVAALRDAGTHVVPARGRAGVPREGVHPPRLAADDEHRSVGGGDRRQRRPGCRRRRPAARIRGRRRGARWGRCDRATGADRDVVPRHRRRRGDRPVVSDCSITRAVVTRR